MGYNYGKGFEGLFYRFVKGLAYVLFRVLFRIEVRGIENLPMEGGIVVASNHVSFLDPPALGAVLPRKANFMARKGLFGIPILGSLIRPFAFPVDRQKTMPSTIKTAIGKLSEGELLVIFPEGRRSHDGRLLEPKKGVGMIVAISKARVMPVFIKGTDKALPVGAGFIRPAKVIIQFGELLDLSSMGNHNDISSEIMKAIEALRWRS